MPQGANCQANNEKLLTQHRGQVFTELLLCAGPVLGNITDTEATSDPVPLFKLFEK